jgi:hypothetical protein
MKKLREKVLEAAKVAQECPENLQQICFEILLKHLLAAEAKPSKTPAGRQEDKDKVEKEEPEGVVEESATNQDDLSDSDLHVKTRRFLEKYGLTLEHLNQLYYKDGDQILPLYDDLKSTRTSESQVRITLLQCLHSSIQTGDFQTAVEAVREEAQTRKCYDSGNWNNNYSNKAGLFDFDKYSKKVITISLSEQGKEEIANLIKELQ